MKPNLIKLDTQAMASQKRFDCLPVVLIDSKRDITRLCHTYSWRNTKHKTNKTKLSGNNKRNHAKD